MYNHKAYIALGSNLQEPVIQVNNAISALDRLPQTNVVKASSLYLTEPLGYDPEQLKTIPDFINAVAEVSTDLSPLELLKAILSIENEAGRERPFVNAPRVLDCDLLLYDDVVMHTKELTLPHPRMHLRSFVLLPLAEIAPELTLPSLTLPDGSNVVELVQSYLNQGIKKLEI
ncbi:MAG: 2-amino-4-hydroxy-6-hydroxymethyldihydropteridine diphosphokinase [Methylotenera sp.]|nr:2-amino-4-hydroxy-6-hydroxymethyldihydropteridine diphosphokinase [Methylotenera sp.]OQW69330.1 MAG: 2-amino-4-hydroxy-6-hydroxymethyldihydropteridine diphosphokinase [Proteobacteria bacterium ST_bin12]